MGNGEWAGGLVSVTIYMYRDSSLALRMTVRGGRMAASQPSPSTAHAVPPSARWQAGGGKNVTLTINCGASRHHNPRAEGPSNLRTFARFAGVKPKTPFFTTLLHNLPPSGGHNLRPLGPSTLMPEGRV